LEYNIKREQKSVIIPPTNAIGMVVKVFISNFFQSFQVILMTLAIHTPYEKVHMHAFL